MDLGAVLVIVGVILAVIDLAVQPSGTPTWTRRGLLAFAVILIGVGVLLGTGDPWIKT